ncbi:MAG: pantetheine-phosphate adenylyltransferase [Candidatus Diapherotrites archaeon]|nr:pantetheine-phosphate adenylyltransferase [Candidatus Diapherotrites archaeon]
MKKAIYPGTFDPITYGHIDVIKRALNIFDELVVAVASRPNKKTLFNIDERLELVKQSIKELKKVKVKKLDGLLVDFAKREKCRFIIKGLRELSDFQNEFQQAIVNRKLSPNMETVLIITDPEYFYFSSSIAKEIAFLGGDVSLFVTPVVEKALKKKYADINIIK